MNADTTQLIQMIEKLDEKHEKANQGTNQEIRNLANQIGELVTVMASAEVHRQNQEKRGDKTEERMDKLEAKIESIQVEIASVKQVQAGQVAERKILDYFIKPAAVIIVGVVLGGAIYAYTMKG